MIRQRLLGAAALLGMAALLVGLPALLLHVGFGSVPSIESWTDLTELLLRRDDGTLALAILKLAGWATWAVLAGMILLEIGARARGVTAPSLRGFSLPQSAARQLVATAAALFVALPASNPAAHAAPAPTPTAAVTVAEDATDPMTTVVADPAPATTEHTVRRGESLWSIAERELGNGRRYTEIAALNSHLLDGRGDGFLKPGWTLHLPVDHDNAAPVVSAQGEAASYTVRKGDTLSAIALDHYGDARAYPRIAEASSKTLQPDGRRLTDPDIIDVGWTLTLPAIERTHARYEGVPRSPAVTPVEPAERVPDETVVQAERPADLSRPATESDPRANTATTPPGAPVPTAVPAADAEADGTETEATEDTAPGWLLTGFTGAGALLAGSLWLALRRRRAAQVRARRPGRMIATPPAELLPVEKTLNTVGAATVADVAFIDEALRRLAAQWGDDHPLPALVAVEYWPEALRLHLADPADLFAPWTKDHEACWRLPTEIDLTQVGPVEPGLPAPYPQLVTVGADDDGHWWLANLEECGVIQVTGDADFAQDFVRHAAVELAVSPWASDVRVECVGVAAEAVAFNPRRVHHHDNGDVAAEIIADAVAMIDRTREAGLDIGTGRANLRDDPIWDSRTLFQKAELRTDLADQLAGLLRDHPRRTGTTLLVVGQAEATDHGAVVRLTQHGRLLLPHVGLDLVAVGLTPGEAAGSAGIFTQADEPDVEVPGHLDVTEGWRAHVNQAGQLVADLTLPRDQTSAEPVTSVLPESDDRYVDLAATTPEGLAALAPQVPVALRGQIERDDAALDEDVRTWFDPACDLPRLMVLGPLSVRVAASGSPTAAASRKPFLTELLAYVATRPLGATTDEVADAMRIPVERVRKHMGVLRTWLGTNPRTGRSHLPDGRYTKAAQTRGRAAYQLEDVLVDADLFRRLRARGEARGADGMDDLRLALKLVTGTPFGQLRRDGGAWLADTERLDQILQCAIVDVAHLVATASLAGDDPTGAQAAAELAASVAPAEEIPQLDLVAALAAQGHIQLAERLLREHVINRSDEEDEIPTVLPERTEQILDDRRWLSRRGGTKASA